MHRLKSQPIFSEDSQTERREPFDFPTRISSFLCHWKVFLVTYMNTDLEGVKQRWRRRQQERQKSILLIYIARQQLCSCIILLCTFVYWPCTTKSTWNFQIPRFNRAWIKDNENTFLSVTSPLAPTSKWTIVSHVGGLGRGSGGHFTLLMVSQVAQLQSRAKIFIAVFRFHNHWNRLLSFYTSCRIDLMCIRRVQLNMELGWEVIKSANRQSKRFLLNIYKTTF